MLIGLRTLFFVALLIAMLVASHLLLFKPRQAFRIFKIEIIRRILGYQFTGQRGFAALARSQQRNHATAFQSLTNLR